MGSKEEILMGVIENELDKRDTELHVACSQHFEAPGRPGMLTRIFNGLEAAFLSPTTQKILTKNSRQNSLANRHCIKTTEKDPKDEETGHVVVVDPILELHKLQTTSTAFAVFESEVARN